MTHFRKQEHKSATLQKQRKLFMEIKKKPKNYIACVTQIEFDAELQNCDMKIESHLQRSKIICAVTAHFESIYQIREENKKSTEISP